MFCGNLKTRVWRKAKTKIDRKKKRIRPCGMVHIEKSRYHLTRYGYFN